MKAILFRTYHPRYTRGRLSAEGFACDTLELPWKDNAKQVSCIPSGTYKVVPRNSLKYGDHLYITNVPNRDLCLLHYGNYAASANPKTGTPDIKGCILVGYGYADLNGDKLPEIVQSRKAFNDMMKACPNGFELTVI